MATLGRLATSSSSSSSSSVSNGGWDGVYDLRDQHLMFMASVSSDGCCRVTTSSSSSTNNGGCSEAGNLRFEYGFLFTDSFGCFFS